MKDYMTGLEISRCRKIIHGVSLATSAIGGGLAQLPGTDSAAIVPLQIGMIISLGQVFGLSLTRGSAQAVLTSQVATYLGRSLSQVLVGWIPGFGNLINALTAGGLTEAIGWGAARDFARQAHEKRKDQEN